MEELRVLWKYRAGNDIWDVSVSADGQVIAAASRDHHAYVLDGEGNLLWKQRTENEVWGVSVSPDGQWIAVGSDDDRAYLYDISGQKRWEFLTGHNVLGVAITPDGRGLAVASRDKNCHFFHISGEGPLWSYRAPQQFIRVATNRDGSLVAAGTYGGEVYLLNGRGEIVLRRKTGGDIWGLALDESGTYLAIASRDDQTFYLFQTDGSLLWSRRVESHALGIAMAWGGEYIVGATRGGQVVLFERDGTERWNFRTGRETHSVAVSRDGRLVIVGTEGGTIFCLENPLPPVFTYLEDAEAVARHTIRKIRHAYAANPYLGICRWFDEFDRALRAQQFALCQALLEEIREQGYPLEGEEWAMVDSREGALWLCQGIVCHQREEHAEAQSCYERSIEIQRRTGNLEGEGQVRTLMRVLEQESGYGSEDSTLLEACRTQPRVLGSGVAFLEKRVRSGSLRERLQVVRAARDSGHPEPLLVALDDEEPAVRMAAAAALCWLRPGADTETLLNMLNREDWFVRWCAATLLGQRLQEESWAPQQEVQERVIRALSEEPDPDVCRELAQLVGQIGDRKSTGILISLLDDPDPDVRFSAVEALARVGDRRALPDLQRLGEDRGKSFDGKSVAEAAQRAIRAIEKRHPMPGVEQIVFCRQIGEDGEPVQPATLFLPREPVVHCVVRVSNPQPEMEVVVRWKYNRRTIAEERKTLAEARLEHREPGESTPLIELVRPLESRRGGSETLGDMLVELVRLLAGSEDSDSEESRRELIAQFHFALAQPTGGWRPGQYRVEVYIDGEGAKDSSFRIVDHVPVERAVMCLGVDDAGHPQGETWVFLSSTPRLFCSVALAEAPAGLRVQGRIYDTTGERLVAEAVTETTSEGRQEVPLWWTQSRWQPGRYRARVVTETGDQAESHFVVVPRVEVQQAIMCRGVDRSGSPVEPVSAYLPDDDFVCWVSLSEAPPAFQVSAEWCYEGRPVGMKRASAFTEKSGKQNVTFRLQKPDNGWLPGQYQIKLYVADTLSKTLTFSVRPRPVIQRLGAAVRRSCALLWQQARYVVLPVFKSVILAFILGFLYRLVDAWLGKVVGIEMVSSTRVLWWGHKVAMVDTWWWLVGGGLYGLLHAYYRQGKVRGLYEFIRSVLTFISTFLLCYQVGYLAFFPGYLWPQALWGLFSRLLWAAPVVAWMGLIIALISVYIVYREKFTFYCVPVLCALIPATLVLSGQLVAIMGGLILGALGWVAGSLLDLIWRGYDFNTRWGYEALGIGASIGFVAQVIFAVVKTIGEAIEEARK